MGHLHSLRRPACWFRGSGHFGAKGALIIPYVTTYHLKSLTNCGDPNCSSRSSRGGSKRLWEGENMQSQISRKLAQTSDHRSDGWQSYAMLVGILVLLTALAGCRSSGPPARTSSEDGVWTVTKAVLATQRSDPGLQGFKDLETMESYAFGRRSREDADLLSYRLYGESLQEARANPRAEPGRKSTDEAIHEKIHSILSADLPVAHFSRDFYENLLSDTRRRSAQDPEFRHQLDRWRVALGRFPDPNSRCYVNGLESTTKYCNSLISHFFVSAIYCKEGGCT
jgi:hypothetical protein